MMNRRAFLMAAATTTASAATAAALPRTVEAAGSPAAAAAPDTHRQPNILVLLTDDHGQWASECYGTDEMVTPSLNYLADTGTRMANAYTPCPVCSPARACFWTGRMPSQHGIHDWINEPVYSHPWLEGEVLLPEVLKAAGYQTGFVGKWHCGQSWIAQRGFDYYLGENKDQYPHKGVCRFTENGVPVEFKGHRSAFLAERALTFLRQRDREKPFFLFVGMVDTHTPFQSHPERLAKRFRKASFHNIPREKYVGPGRATHPAPTEESIWRGDTAEYYAAASFVDQNLGALLDELDGKGDLDNTLVVYAADHGHMNGHHGLYTKGNATVPQNFYEESIRVPCLLRWPGHIAAGRVSTLPTSHCDLFQTLLDAAGCPESGERAAARNSPGRSFLPLLAEGSSPESDQSAAPSLWFCEYGNARMVRDQRHKLIVRYPPHAPHFSDELYDLEADPRETTNRISDPSAQPTVRRLQESLDAFFAKHEVPGHSGKDIEARPVYNDHEPWRA